MAGKRPRDEQSFDIDSPNPKEGQKKPRLEIEVLTPSVIQRYVEEAVSNVLKNQTATENQRPPYNTYSDCRGYEGGEGFRDVVLTSSPKVKAPLQAANTVSSEQFSNTVQHFNAMLDQSAISPIPWFADRITWELEGDRPRASFLFLSLEAQQTFLQEAKKLVPAFNPSQLVTAWENFTVKNSDGSDKPCPDDFDAEKIYGLRVSLDMAYDLLSACLNLPSPIKTPRLSEARIVSALPVSPQGRRGLFNPVRRLSFGSDISTPPQVPMAPMRNPIRRPVTLSSSSVRRLSFGSCSNEDTSPNSVDSSSAWDNSPINTPPELSHQLAYILGGGPGLFSSPNNRGGYPADTHIVPDDSDDEIVGEPFFDENFLAR